MMLYCRGQHETRPIYHKSCAGPEPLPAENHLRGLPTLVLCARPPEDHSRERSSYPSLTSPFPSRRGTAVRKPSSSSRRSIHLIPPRCPAARQSRFRGSARSTPFCSQGRYCPPRGIHKVSPEDRTIMSDDDDKPRKHRVGPRGGADLSRPALDSPISPLCSQKHCWYFYQDVKPSNSRSLGSEP